MHMTCPVDKVTAKPKNPESENEQEVPLWPLIVLQGHIFADFFCVKKIYWNQLLPPVHII